MKASYTPFTGPKIIETHHGIINKEARRYFTHRKPEHFFRKYQGFAISITEVEMAKRNHCDHVLLKYHGKKKNILYRININYLKYLPTHDNNGDEQIILPLKEMKVIGEEEGLKEHEGE